jgi:hypothetical protein
MSDYKLLIDNMSSSQSVWMAMMTALDSQCTKNDYYGWAAIKSANKHGGASDSAWQNYFMNGTSSNDLILRINDRGGYTFFDCGYWSWWGSEGDDLVRCIRQL